MRQIELIKSKAIFLNGLQFNLTEDTTEWLAQHSMFNWQLTSKHLFDKDGPFIEFGDDVPEALINWFILRWS